MNLEKKQPMQTIASNRKAFHDYEIGQTLESGIVLTGAEIKSVRSHRVTLTGSYAKLVQGELFWIGGDIDGQRTRKLLVSKRELQSAAVKLQHSMTLVPLRLYLKRGYAKLELGFGKRKKLWDKRNQIKQRDRERATNL